MKNKNNNLILPIVIAVILVVAVAVSAYLYFTAPVVPLKGVPVYGVPITQSPVFCTLEAKQCPDGSYVSRSGPNCEFDPCPGIAPSTR